MRELNDLRIEIAKEEVISVDVEAVKKVNDFVETKPLKICRGTAAR